MTYPGDPSLAADIQSRVLATFEQTAKLAAEGKLQEASLGCDFMLRLDPLFTPARRLQDRLQSADGPVTGAADLLGGRAPEPSPEVLKTVRLSAEELEKLMNESGGGPPLREQQAGEIEQGPLAESSLAEDLFAGDDQTAEARSFLDGARRALDSGQIEAARRLLDMATSLDPHSPELQDMLAELERITSGPGAAPPSGGDRIGQLLADGQRAFDDERYQDAIDCWSRIFLIEIDHEEASRRIQLARDLKEEQDRQVEETFHQGLGALDAGRTEEASAAFRRILAMQPNHLAAREQLDRLATADAAARTEEDAGAGPTAAPAAVPADLQVAPEEPSRAADPTYRMAARAKRKPVNPLFLVGAGVLVAVLLGVWLLIENWDRLFPNAVEEVAPDTGRRIAEITAIYESGELEAAIAAAEQVPAESPEYLDARRLLVRWRDELASREAEVEPLSGDEAERHGTLVADARRAYDAERYLEAARFFTRASAISPLGAGEAALFDDSKRQLEPIAQQIDLYTQRQWDLVLAPLWRRLEQVPEDKDVRQLLVNSYYNLTVRELRRGELATAGEYAKEALRLAPEDREVERLGAFVTSYSSMPRDLLFEIFVQHLDFRR